MGKTLSPKSFKMQVSRMRKVRGKMKETVMKTNTHRDLDIVKKKLCRGGGSKGKKAKAIDEDQSIKSGEEESPKKDRQNTGKGSGWSIQTIVEANKEFSRKVYPEMVKAVGADKNFICSIFSLSAAMAMVREGAKGKTREEMDLVLSLPNDGALEGFRAALKKFQSNEYHTIEAATKLYVDNKHELNPDYQSKVGSYFMAETESFDLSQQELAARTINGWVEENTDGKIKDILPTINEGDDAVLVNAASLSALTGRSST